MVKIKNDNKPKKLNISNMNTNVNDDKNGDVIFDPSIEMLIHDFDDERTIEEEEALEGNEDPQIELSDLQREGEMPLSELLAMYGYNDSENGTEKEEETEKEDEKEENKEKEMNRLGNKLNSPETSSSNDVTDHLPGGENTFDEGQCYETDSDVQTSDLVKLYANIPASGFNDENSGTSRFLRSVSRPQSEEEEDDCDYSPDEEEWKKTIMVGSDYQAKIPVGLCKYDDALPYENDDKMLWDPSRLTEEETKDFLVKAHESLVNNPKIPPGAHVKDDEQALYLLLQCGYNMDEALRRRRINAVPPADTMSIWSEEECRNFETGMKIFGKDFHTIQKNKVRTRSVGELVQFYYLWKKTERHDIYAHKSRMEKKKFALHPGITDYMERFLEEQEVNSGHQDPGTAPNLHLLVYTDSKKHNKLEEGEEASAAIHNLGDYVGHFDKDNMKTYAKINPNTDISKVSLDNSEMGAQQSSGKSSTVVIKEDVFAGKHKE